MKKNLRKVLASLFAAVMLLTAAPLAGIADFDWGGLFVTKVSAEEPLTPTGQCGDNVYWNFNSDTGLLTISGTGEMYDYEIGDSPFYDIHTIKNVVIEDSVTHIGDYTFCYCAGITDIDFPDSLTSIGGDAFCDCDNLKEVILPENLNELGRYVSDCFTSVFGYCDSLTTVYVPKSISEILEGVFSRCKNLKNFFYNGTAEQWDAIVGDDRYDSFPEDYYLHLVNSKDEIDNHIRVVDRADPGCKISGYINYECDCGYSYFDYIPSLGHEYVNGECIRCNIKYKVYDISLNENKEAIIENPGDECFFRFIPEESGMYYFFSDLDLFNNASPSCEVYDEDMNWIDSGGDISDFWIYRYFEAGKTYYFKTGYVQAYDTGRYYVCLSDTFVDYHDMSYIETISPTCTEQGYDLFYCNRCKKYYNDNYTKPLGHNFINDVCTRCGIELETISLNELKSVQLSDEVTNKCIKFIPEESGEYYFFSDSAYDTYGIVYDSEMNQIASDDDSGGNYNFLISYELEKGKTYYLEVSFYSPQNGSFFVGVTDNFVSCHDGTVIDIIQPSCTNIGYTVYHCSRCDYDYEDDYTEALGHDFENDICARCGYEMQSIILEEMKSVQLNENNSEFFKFVPKKSGEYYFYSIGKSDTVGFIYDENMDEIVYDDDGGSYYNFEISFYFEAGKKYYLEVQTYSGKNESFTFTVSNSHVENIVPNPGTETVIDDDSMYIYGIKPEMDEWTIRDCFSISGKYDYCFQYEIYIGTGSTLSLYSYDDDTETEYTFIIFGDVNGDGWYDGTDSIIVNCLANGLLSREQVGEAVYMAADCNHDDVIDSADVALLEQAGIILASVDQTKSEAELMTDAAYVEYLSLIDQSPEEETVVDTTENSTSENEAGKAETSTEKTDTSSTEKSEEKPVNETVSKSFIQRIIDFITYLFKMMKSFIPKF